jgi:hypothetical protein
MPTQTTFRQLSENFNLCLHRKTLKTSLKQKRDHLIAFVDALNYIEQGNQEGSRGTQ